MVQNGLPSGKITRSPAIITTEPDKTAELVAESVASLIAGLVLLGVVLTVVWRRWARASRRLMGAEAGTLARPSP